MGASPVVAHYQALAALTGQMLDAARRGEWDTLPALEAERSTLVARIKPLDGMADLDEAERQRKSALIRETIAMEREIRERVERWMEEFRLNMQGNSQELRVLRKYAP